MTLEQQQKLEETYVMHTFGRKPVEFVRGDSTSSAASALSASGIAIRRL